MRPIKHVWLGLYYGYPLCCILRFALGIAVGQGEQAKRRGVVRIAPGRQYVPCCRLHASIEPIRAFA